MLRGGEGGNFSIFPFFPICLLSFLLERYLSSPSGSGEWQRQVSLTRCVTPGGAMCVCVRVCVRVCVCEKREREKKRERPTVYQEHLT